VSLSAHSINRKEIVARTLLGVYSPGGEFLDELTACEKCDCIVFFSELGNHRRNVGKILDSFLVNFVELLFKV
jgi:hypothetical protein